VSDENISFVDVINSIDKLSEKIKQKVISNTFSLNDLVEISKPKFPVLKRRYNMSLKEFWAKEKEHKAKYGEEYTSGWNLSEIKGLGPSALKIINETSKIQLEKRKKIIAKRAQFAAERKKIAFMKVNHQPLFDRMSMTQRENAWTRSSGYPYRYLDGICDICREKCVGKLPISPFHNDTCERNDLLVGYLDAGLTGKISGGARADRMNREQQLRNFKNRRDSEIGFLSYTNDISFFWVLFPTLSIIMSCNSCAIEAQFLETSEKK
tara:strand:+ start:290 stop:1087 length:798 start_codon:yes stop_codon:yes gene_type:complete